MKISQWLFTSLIFTQVLGGLAHGQGAHARTWSPNVVIPQARAYSMGRTPALQITEVVAGVVIRDQVATTVMEVRLRNPGSTRQEAELLVPVPDKAVVRGFTFQGTGAEPSARLLPRDEAREAYERIVAQARDPALLEFAGYQPRPVQRLPGRARGYSVCPINIRTHTHG